LFGLLFLAHVSAYDADERDFLYMLPVGVAAASGGIPAGLFAATAAFGLSIGSAAFDPDGVDAIEFIFRAGGYYLLGASIGFFAQRLRQTTQRLRVASQRLSGMIDTARDGILELDSRGRITTVNGAIERLFGYPRDELVGSRVERLLPGMPMTASGTGVVLTGRASDGKPVPVELTFSRRGDLTTLVMRDVTQRLQTEERLARARAELERSNEALDEFAHVVSHDLTEHLSTAWLYARTLEGSYGRQLEADGRGLVDRILAVIDGMQEHVDGLLDYAEASATPRPHGSVDCNQAVREALAALEWRMVSTDARISCGRLPSVVGDPVHIRQLFQNLLSNAMKFTPDGQPPRIRVTGSQTGAVCVFSVADQGMGISEEDCERIFQPLERGSHGGRPGSGIGLAVCMKVVELHGGRIWVKSRPGQGSTFDFALPAAEPADSEPLVTAPRASQTPGGAASPSHP
jgi:PAS domain S-box-containing protein